MTTWFHWAAFALNIVWCMFGGLYFGQLVSRARFRLWFPKGAKWPCKVFDHLWIRLRGEQLAPDTEGFTARCLYCGRYIAGVSMKLEPGAILQTGEMTVEAEVTREQPTLH